MQHVITPLLLIALAVYATFSERQRSARSGRPMRRWLVVLLGVGIVFGVASLVLALAP